jgi:hypothetical protein
VDAVYFQVPADEMTELRVENEQGTFEFVKEGDTWTLADLAEGEVLDETAVGRLVSRAASVSLQRPLGREEQPDYGLTAPTAVVTVWTADGETRILRVGAYLPDESAYVVTSSRSPYYVTASEFSLSDFVESGRDDWLVQPTAVPEATPEGP